MVGKSIHVLPATIFTNVPAGPLNCQSHNEAGQSGGSCGHPGGDLPRYHNRHPIARRNCLSNYENLGSASVVLGKQAAAVAIQEVTSRGTTTATHLPERRRQPTQTSRSQRFIIMAVWYAPSAWTPVVQSRPCRSPWPCSGSGGSLPKSP